MISCNFATAKMYTGESQLFEHVGTKGVWITDVLQ